MSVTLGVEGELPSGDHSWDVSLYTGRADNTVNQLGSMRLTTLPRHLVVAELRA